jgi:hypothetical protein
MTDPEWATLDSIFETVHDALQDRSQIELEFFQDEVQDWVKRWSENSSEPAASDDEATQEWKRELVRLGCGEGSPWYVSWCKGPYCGRWGSRCLYVALFRL